MKKTLFAFSMVLLSGAYSYAATPWWQEPTICRPNPTNCYASMGTGFDSGLWDTTGNCWGLKFVCPVATIAVNTEPVPMNKSAILAGTGIKTDFDTNVLNGDCFGARKTSANGTMASVNGTFVKVWCPSVLLNYDENVPNGEIKFGAQPKCKELAPDGWIAVLNQKCYGKYYNPDNYYIECDSTGELPTKIVILNGADKIVGTGSAPTGYPTDSGSANSIFDTMQTVSATKRAEHF